ncbi:MAG: bifunctional folylpolyglutamate synthase/dihydrofolate synthase [Prevotella sp.]|nr:bifunctional folylpolyglutamate synthase/dihydrofolate synthase [Prevotella sp.]
MTYTETCQYLYNQIPMFENLGIAGYKEGLENTLKLDEHYGHPHRHYLTIHVAGTNGKGSCAHTLAAILQKCGYTVGLYTSPHLVDFDERIRVNGQPINHDYVVEFVNEGKSFFAPLNPSFFEVTTAMAFKYFSDKHVDIAVIEVGLGGRLDCTNIINPILSVITNISYDHMQQLGYSLEQIAMEKAGIMKKGVPVVIGETTPETRGIFEAVARETDAPIIFAEDHPEVQSVQLSNNGMQYDTVHYGTILGELRGLYQEKNTNTILTAVRQLEELGFMYRFKDDSEMKVRGKEIAEGFKLVCEITGLKGRWQTISKSPLVICDTGHNVGGWTYLSKQIELVKCNKKHIVFGMVDDKDMDGIMALLPKNATYYFAKSSNKRAVSENVLKIISGQRGLEGEGFPSVIEAYNSARNAAGPDDFVFIGGSTYVVADFLRNRI